MWSAFKRKPAERVQRGGETGRHFRGRGDWGRQPRQNEDDGTADKPAGHIMAAVRATLAFTPCVEVDAPQLQSLSKTNFGGESKKTRIDVTRHCCAPAYLLHCFFHDFDASITGKAP